jgi:sensor domain CHASE-containing protein
MVVEWTENKRFIENQRRSFVKQLSTIRAKLEGDLNAELLLTRSIITEVTIDADITKDRFFKIAEQIFKASKHIRNIGLAKGTILTYVYPVKGNEKAIGIDYKNIPSQWPAVKRVIENRKTVVAGPLNLVQGGIGIIGRSPIYIGNAWSGIEEYFGILSVVINIPSLFQAAGLNDKDPLLKVSMRGKDGLGAKGEVFYGSEDIFANDPVLMEVTLPEGNWLMAATPVNGWEKTSPSIIYYRVVALVIGVVILFLLFIQQREMNIRKKVEEEREEIIKELREALSEVKQLSGLLPICANCKKVRDDKGYWKQIESYIMDHSDAEFSHSICQDCAKKLYPDLVDEDGNF